MNEKIKAVEKMLQELLKEPKRSPYLDVAIGGLRTFLENARQHDELTVQAVESK